MEGELVVTAPEKPLRAESLLAGEKGPFVAAKRYKNDVTLRRINGRGQEFLEHVARLLLRLCWKLCAVQELCDLRSAPRRGFESQDAQDCFTRRLFPLLCRRPASVELRLMYEPTQRVLHSRE